MDLIYYLQNIHTYVQLYIYWTLKMKKSTERLNDGLALIVSRKSKHSSQPTSCENNNGSVSIHTDLDQLNWRQRAEAFYSE